LGIHIYNSFRVQEVKYFFSAEAVSISFFSYLFVALEVSLVVFGLELGLVVPFSSGWTRLAGLSWGTCLSSEL